MLVLFKEMQIKTMRHYLTLVRMAIIKMSTNIKCQWEHGEKGPLVHIGRNINWCSHYGIWRFLKLKVGLPYDPATQLLGIYPEKIQSFIWKDACTPVFRAALFTIAKPWK